MKLLLKSTQAAPSVYRETVICAPSKSVFSFQVSALLEVRDFPLEELNGWVKKLKEGRDAFSASQLASL